MWVLALDTATADLVAGVVNTSTGVQYEELIGQTRHHNELLVPTVNEVLERAGITYADLGAIVVGCGPGPFTGLRVGMSTASAFGQALGLPVHGVVTHDAIASRLNDDGRCLVATDARRREVYWAVYQGGSRVSGPDVTAPADVLPGEAVDVLNVPDHLADALQVEPTRVTHLGPSATALVETANLDEEPAPLTPLYLRRPDAKEPKPKPPSPAIPEVRL